MLYRFYLDTSVIGGVFDPEFRVSGRVFIEEVMARGDQFIVSPLVLDEIRSAPPRVGAYLDSLGSHTKVWIPDARVAILRDAYIESGIITPKWLSDATHVAIATVSMCRAIVSWNYKHIVHMDKIPRYNEVNRRHGYEDIAIHTPDEVLNYG